MTSVTFHSSMFLLVIMITAASAQNDTVSCPRGFWGEDCMNVCGECEESMSGTEQPLCDFETGKCPNSGCLGGYTGKNCDMAVCEGGCGPGECLAPEYCSNCGSINHVTPNCEDIRLRGLLGSLVAFFVIISSISLCGFGSVWYKRRQSAPVHL